MKTVANFLNPLEAHIALGRLRTEGVDASILHEHHVWADWMSSLALGGVKIIVPESQFEIAQQILRYYHAGDFAELLEDQQQNSCPRCGDKNIKRQHTLQQKITMLLTFGVFGWIIPLPQKHFYCNCCQFAWYPKADE